MADYDITAANSVFTITVPGLYNAPITLQNYAADRAFETEARELAETAMSIDGYLNAGWVPNPVTQTIALAASSESALVFEAIVMAQDSRRGLYRMGAEIQIRPLAANIPWCVACCGLLSAFPAQAACWKPGILKSRGSVFCPPPFKRQKGRAHENH